ncbi:YciI family protein [Nocardioides dongkuii]|uniref:YciI family protein n=1 Tax=Nocardioides dongkuii TaxID=2760089 RepID=UPI00187859FD|nr:YciI family protein [Nocardioides dongkuii]
MPIFCATYAYDPAATETLDAVRPAHRDWLAEQPALLASGPTDDGGAVLVWEGGSAAEVEAILDQDPFHAAGVIAERRVVGWQIVRGRWLDVLDLG